MFGCAQNMVYHQRWSGNIIGWGGTAHRNSSTWRPHEDYGGQVGEIPQWFLTEFRGRNQAYMDGHVEWFDTANVDISQITVYGKTTHKMPVVMK